MSMEHKIICIMGFSGSGKDTTMKRLLEQHEDLYGVVSTTTRPMRDGEKEGREYYFVDDAEFNAMLDAGQFLEVRQYKVADGSLWFYGFTEQEVNEKLRHGNVIMVIDLQGYKEIKEIYENKCIGIFLDVSLDILINRILNREKLTWFVAEEAVRRIKSDMERFVGIENVADYIIHTDNTDYTVQEIKKIIYAKG